MESATTALTLAQGARRANGTEAGTSRATGEPWANLAVHVAALRAIMLMTSSAPSSCAWGRAS